MKVKKDSAYDAFVKQLEYKIQARMQVVGSGFNHESDEMEDYEILRVTDYPVVEGEMINEEYDAPELNVEGLVDDEVMDTQAF